MKNPFSIVVWMLVISVFMKMVIYAAGLQFTVYEKVYFFINLFVLMTGIFLGIRLFKNLQPEKTSFLADVKSGMKVASMYAVLFCAFIYLYYTYIDVSYFNIKLENQLALAEANEKVTATDLKNMRTTGEFILSAYFQSTVTLIGFILLGTFYSSILTFFMRKVRRES